MGDLGALDNIEADIQFCEDVLNYKGQLPSGRHRADLHRVGSVRLSQGDGSSQATQRSPASRAAASPAAQRQHASPALHGKHPRQQPKATQQANQQQQQQPIKPRNIEELWAVLDSAPTGQPVEIDAGLLYGQESSYDASQGPSPSGSCWGSPSGGSKVGQQQGQKDSRRWQAADIDDFQLPAYRPPAATSAASEPPGGDVFAGFSPSRGSQGWYPGGSPSPSSQRHRGLRGGGGGTRPASAPHVHWGRIEELEQEGQEEVEAPCTSGRSSQQLHHDAGRGSRAGPAAAELLRAGRQERLEQLAAPRTHMWQRCSARRAQQEREALAECTFAPQTGRPPSRTRLASGLPVEERLLAARHDKEQALERARQEVASAEVAGCTFAPQLVTDPDRHLRSKEQHRPLHQRLGEEQRRRSSKLAQARMLEDVANPDLTFRPQLNQRSLALAEAREERELFSPAGRAGHRPGSAGAGGRSRGSEGEEAGCSFSPAINPLSKQLVEDSPQVPADFHERQRFYTQRRAAAAARSAAASGADACTFRPDTGNAVEVLAASGARAGQLLESEAQRCARMAQEEAAAQAARRAAKEAEIYGQLEFRPQLNQRSLAIGKSQGIEGLASAEKRRQRLEELRAAEEARLRAECTFRPDTSKPRVLGYYSEYQPPQPSSQSLSIASAAVQGFEGLTQRIAEREAEREARAAAARAAAEAAELAECSFSPAINRGRMAKPAPGAVVVPGLDRFLELKALAERQRQEAEERAAKVFNASPGGGALAQGRRATVPKPFRLKGHSVLEARAAARSARQRVETLAEQLESCTFKPATNVAARKAQLAKLLAAADSGDWAPADL